MTTDSEFNVPLIIRGEIIDDYEVSFAGRNGGVAFRTPDVSKYMNRLTKGDAAALAAYQDVKVEEIARFLNELSGMLNLDKNSAWKRAYELSVHTSGLTAPILEFLYTYGARKALAGAARDDHWKVGKPLYWAVMVSGIGMLLIRVSSSHGWWTGHLM